MAVFRMNQEEFHRVQQAIKAFQGDAERVINDVLHNEGGPLILDEIKNLMPVSKRQWNGKKVSAKSGKSLMITGDNLSVTVKTTKNYQYLYFPDDGTNTRKHVGNQQFFLHGAENKTEEIINRCIDGLVDTFEEVI